MAANQYKRTYFRKYTQLYSTQNRTSCGGFHWRYFSKITALTLVCIFSLNISFFSYAQEQSFNKQREESVQSHLNEFCSASFLLYYPKIYKAIKNVLMKIPQNVFIEITDRNRPVMFSEYHTTGIGRFANSSEIYVFPDDPPTFQKGMTFIKLSTELESTDTSKAIEGVVAHEIAHRFLEHARKQIKRCKREKEANHLIVTWGFEKEFELARMHFGREKDEKSGCE